MAHNSYYPPQTSQQAPVVQQQQGSSPGGHQYAQYYQQPQNIYQQLGQAQPQPHLQRLYQQPQYQPQQPAAYGQPSVQSHGFVQRPLSSSFQAPQQGFGNAPPPSHTPFQQPPLQQQPYASQPYQQLSQYNTLQQPPPPPLSRTPSATGFVPKTSYAPPPSGFPNQPGYPNQAPPSSPQQQQQQRRTPQPPVQQGYITQIQPQQGHMVVQDAKPPPISLSAKLAQQVQVQRIPQAPPGSAPSSQVQMQIRAHQQQQQQQQLMQSQPHTQMQQQQPQLANESNAARRALPLLVLGDPPTVSLIQPGTINSRPMSMPPTKTGRPPSISTSSSASSFGSQMNQTPNPPYTPQRQQPMSAATIPPPNFVQQQIAQLQQMQLLQSQGQGSTQAKPSGSGILGASNSSASSPTKSRPLPMVPGGAAAKRTTVDLGNVSGLPTPNNGSGFKSSNSGSLSSSYSSQDGNPAKGGNGFNSEMQSGGDPSPTKRFALASTPSSAGGSGTNYNGGAGATVSRTTSMASSQPFSSRTSSLDIDNAPKHRASPPRFSSSGSSSSSLSSSPTKEGSQRMGWNSDISGSPSKTVNVFANRSSTNLSAQGLNNGGPTTSNLTANASTTTTPQKFTPVWKRTIPDYPVPVFGYAAGMVADPFAKPSTSPNTSAAASSPNKNDTTPKAVKVSPSVTAKEKKKQEKEEKKRLKEDEKQRRKMVKERGGAAPTPAVPQRIESSPSGSSPGSMLPYLQPTPPKMGAPGEYAKAYAQAQQQRVGVGAMAPYSTPTRQIQVRGQPVAPGAVTRYTKPPVQPQEELTEDDDDDQEEDDDEGSELEDLEVAYQYEGSDFSSASEQEYSAPAGSRKVFQQRQIQEQQHEEQQYYEQVQQEHQQQMIHLRQPQKTKKSTRTRGSPQQYEEYEEQSPIPNSRHVKTRSSASDGFVVVHQQSPTQRFGGKGKEPRKSGAVAIRASPDRRPPVHHARGQTHSHSNSEDDWEQLQAYDSSPRKIKPLKGKGRRYEELSEEEEAEEEVEQQFEERRRQGQGHRREMSERDAGTVRKYVRGQEHGSPRGSPTKEQQVVVRGVRERVQDIDWTSQPQRVHRQYQQQLKHDDDEIDGRGRQKKKELMAGKKPSKGSIIKEILSPRSRSRHAYTEPEDEEGEEEYEQYAKHQKSKSQSQSPAKKQIVQLPPRKLVKKGSKRYFSNAAASETDSQAESQNGEDNESVATNNTQASATSRLASKFAGVIKFTGGQQKQSLQSSQRSPTRDSQPQPQRQSVFQPPSHQGFQNQPGKKLYFGISDHPPPTPSPPSNPTTFASNQAPPPPPSRIRGEVNRERVNLKPDMLDDPPPRSLRTPSPSPAGNMNAARRQSMYHYPSEVEQQRQPQALQQSGLHQQQQRRPQSQIYNSTPKSSFMDDIPSRGGELGTEQPQGRQLPQPQQLQGQQQRQDLSQPKVFDPTTGLPMYHQQAMQGYAPPPQAPMPRPPPQQRPLPQQYTGQQSAPSTPRQQQPITIESPAPLKMANLIKMEADGVEHEKQQEHRQHLQQNQYQNQNIPSINVGGVPESPRINIHHTGGTAMSSSTQRSSPSMIPMINFDPAPAPPSLPMINISETPSGPAGGSNGIGPAPPSIQVFEIPGITVAGPEFDERPSNNEVNINTVSGDNRHHGHNHGQQQQSRGFASSQGSRALPTRSGTGGLICGGCEGPIVGRIVSAMGVRWHPQCFQCTVCQELLEHVSSYEHDGRPYCHLDYHENFAPRCYSCKTPIIEEQFISLDDSALGKRTYHMEHFFCAECGDPFLTPSMSRTSGELALSGDGDFEGFTVYKGHPYCEACHVRLRLPKCKKCKKSIRDHERAVEALGGKWCWTCFVCEGCEQPFEDPSFFQRDNRPFCENCFSIILRNEV